MGRASRVAEWEIVWGKGIDRWMVPLLVDGSFPKRMAGFDLKDNVSLRLHHHVKARYRGYRFEGKRLTSRKTRAMLHRVAKQQEQVVMADR